MNDIEQKAQQVVERFELLEKEPLTLKRVHRQQKILEDLSNIVPDKTSLEEPILEKLVEVGYQSLTNIVAVYPFDEGERGQEFIEGITDWDREAREVFADHLSELKYKQPELYHPVFDQIIVL